MRPLHDLPIGTYEASCEAPLGWNLDSGPLICSLAQRPTQPLRPESESRAAGPLEPLHRVAWTPITKNRLFRMHGSQGRAAERLLHTCLAMAWPRPSGKTLTEALAMALAKALPHISSSATYHSMFPAWALTTSLQRESYKLYDINPAPLPMESTFASLLHSKKSRVSFSSRVQLPSPCTRMRFQRPLRTV